MASALGSIITVTVSVDTAHTDIVVVVVVCLSLCVLRFVVVRRRQADRRRRTTAKARGSGPRVDCLVDLAIVTVADDIPVG